MDNQEAIVFLFTIAKEIKRSFENPVILVTMKDYADDIFNSLVNMKTALLQQESPKHLLEIITAFHHEWLQAVDDVEHFKKRIRDIPRDAVLNAVEFTKERAKKRHDYFQQYIHNLVGSIPPNEQILIEADLETIKDMQDSVISILSEKHASFCNYADQTEYYHKVEDEIEELLNWLDNLNDNLAIHFSKVVGLKLPYLTSTLSKPLQQIIDDLATSSDTETQKMLQEMQRKGHQMSYLVGVNDPEELEIRNVLEKIKILEERIDRLKNINSSAVMALQHKAIYLEERLLSLENLKTSLFTLKNKYNSSNSEKYCALDKYIQIFDHLLPAPERDRLVEQLINVWKDAISVTCHNRLHEGKSIISILSVADFKEIFADDIGKFTIDKFGRKLYTQQDGISRQVNERNQLVELNDDDKHIYFYDDCGRYYVNNENQRIYKSSECASEYQINPDGIMLKTKEVVDGIEYNYDSLGRYHVNEYGKHIYRDPGATEAEEYEHDGLGNLVLIRREDPNYESCPIDTTIATEENKYLQQTVGDALKKCIAEVVIHKPQDPIGFLAKCLVKYRLNIQDRQKGFEDEIEMMAERDLRAMQTSEPSSYYSADENPQSDDTNFENYKTMATKDF